MRLLVFSCCLVEVFWLVGWIWVLLVFCSVLWDLFGFLFCYKGLSISRKGNYYKKYLKMPSRIIGGSGGSFPECLLMFCPSHQEFQQRNKNGTLSSGQLDVCLCCQEKRAAIPFIWRRLEKCRKHDKTEQFKMITSHITS